MCLSASTRKWRSAGLVAIDRMTGGAAFRQRLKCALDGGDFTRGKECLFKGRHLIFCLTEAFDQVWPAFLRIRQPLRLPEIFAQKVCLIDEVIVGRERSSGRTQG